MNETRVDFCYDIASNSDLNEGEDVADSRVLDDHDVITIEFTYPLRRPISRTFSREGGFTYLDFAQTVATAYAEIYAEEEHSRTSSPEPRGMLMNRSETDGIYGIWGHDINDLVLEAARLENGIWHLAVGS